LSESLKGAKLIYDREYTWIFHSPGLEPWVCGLLRRLNPVSVLDVGCGLGYWGFILKGYLGVPHVVGVDIDSSKVEFARRLGVYDELYTSDIREFNYPRAFDVVLAIESIHGILDTRLLERLEGFTRKGGLIVLALPTFSKSITISDLIKRGYITYRYLLRGFLLVRVDKAEYATTPTRLWRIVGFAIMFLHPVLRVMGVFRRGYILAVKVV